MVKSTKGALVGYRPAPPPQDLPPSAQRYLDDELNRIAALLQGLQVVAQPVETLQATMPNPRMLILEESDAPPDNPQMPALVFADGVNWDPGSGPGFYYWNNSVWTPLG